MDKESIKSNVDNAMVDLLMTYDLLKSTIEIFSEAIVCGADSEDKYVNMLKLIHMLVGDVEPCIKELCENLDNLLMTEENQKV